MDKSIPHEEILNQDHYVAYAEDVQGKTDGCIRRHSTVAHFKSESSGLRR